ncbi:MAG: hypothetical protein VB009_00475 [Erysipelotrichaceae bacterium]|nr:hypothetical protein [Erysipelotrichaceae bacterium]
MKNLNELIKKYQQELASGDMQIAYRAIFTVISKIRSILSSKYPDYNVSSLYPGYMDMTYFSLTPTNLRKKQLKIAIVYLHENNTFEIWLSANNKRIQKMYIDKFKDSKLKGYSLSEPLPKVDSIIVKTIVTEPDFNDVDKLSCVIENEIIAITDSVNEILKT